MNELMISDCMSTIFITQASPEQEIGIANHAKNSWHRTFPYPSLAPVLTSAIPFFTE
jgi:hypothetical protein